MLVDRSNRRTVGTTDPSTHTVTLSTSLSGLFKRRVLLHELGHCAMISYGLLDDIHEAVLPEYWVDAEEWVCNFLADYGETIFEIANQILNNEDEAIMYIPYSLDKIFY